MGIRIGPFGQLKDGREAELITLTNQKGESVSLTNFGAHIVSILVRDRGGALGEVCLGQDNAQAYAARNIGYMGGTIGRYANRIGGSSFDMDGVRYSVSANEGANSLHGGRDGFDQKLWKYETDKNSVLMRYTSPDMEEGYPGELRCEVRFSFDDESRLTIEYSAVSDRDTQVNLTNHAYFNLSEGEDIRSHSLQILADQVLEVNEELIPTGRMLDVAGTPFDLRKPSPVAEAWEKPAHPMFDGAKGFDVAYVLGRSEGLRKAAVLLCDETGREMSVLTDQVGIQCYSGQGLDCAGRGGRHYGPFAGLALETQRHPDTPNHPNFGSARLKAGEEYRAVTVYAFAVR